MLKIVNQTVPLELRTIGSDQPQSARILAYSTITIDRGSPDVKRIAPRPSLRLCPSNRFTTQSARSPGSPRPHDVPPPSRSLSGAILEHLNMPGTRTTRTLPKRTSTLEARPQSASRSSRDARRSQRFDDLTEGRPRAAAPRANAATLTGARKTPAKPHA